MKELTNRLMMFTNNDNTLIIDTLVSVIIENNINNLDELKVLEDSYHDSNLSLKEKIDVCYQKMVRDIYKFDNMSSDEIDKLDELKAKYINSSKIEEKIILIIKIYELLHYQMMFPFCTYSLIVEGKI